MKYETNFLLYTIFIFLITACSSTTHKVEYIGGSGDALTILHDSIHINNYILTREQGSLLFNHNGLKLYDLEQNHLYTLDTNFQILDTLIKQGHGPSETPSVGSAFIAKSDADAFLVLGSSYDFYLFNSDYNREQTALLDWKSKSSPKELKRKPNPENPKQYNPAYNTTLQLPIVGNVFLLPLVSIPRPYTSFSSTSDGFIKKAYLTATFDINSGDFVELKERYPLEFEKKNIAKDFLYHWFDQSDDSSYYFSFMADSLIFKYDSTFTIRSSFGNRGKYISNIYEPIGASSDELYISEYSKQLKSKDVLTNVKAFNNGEIVFRSGIFANFKKGLLQVYKNYLLTNEIVVPKNLVISTQKGNTYYSNPVIAESDGQTYIHTFTVENNDEK
jgi:hypothetical protein